MSATLTATIESLHIAAAQKLVELINTQTDPHLLARLIATAFRLKLPKLRGDTTPVTPDLPPHPNRARKEADRRTYRTESAEQTLLTNAHTSSSSLPSASPHTDHDDEIGEGPYVSPPPPYTDQQYLDLVNQYGHTEADSMRLRRFTLIAHLSRDQKTPATAG